jgi:hypothetical protein
MDGAAGAIRETMRLSAAGALTVLGTVSGATYGSDGSVTDAELLYINTVTSNVQTQIDAISFTPTVTFDGNKTSDTLFVVVNDNDGSVGDSAFVVLPSGLIKSTGGATDANNTLADSLELTGALELPDEQAVVWGTDKNWQAFYDEDVDDQLLFITAGTAATAITDPLFEILVGTTPTANQEVFGIAKGTQASNTSVFSVDEDGDVIIGDDLNLSEGGIISTGDGSISNRPSILISNSELTLRTSTAATENVNLDILPYAAGVDGEIRIGDTGTANEYVKIDSVGLSYHPNGILIGATTMDGDSSQWIDDATRGSATTTMYIGNNTIDVTAPSDRRLKSNFQDLDKGLAEILSLTPQSYEYTYAKGKREVGIVAQDVEAVYPYAVGERSDGYLETDYKKLIPLLVNAIQEQQKQIDELRKQIKDK